MATLDDVKRSVESLIALDTKISELESELEKSKREFKEISETILPPLMFELELSDFRSGNVKVALESVIGAKLPTELEARRAAIDWLVDRGEGGAVKRQLEVFLPKGDAVMEEKVVDALLAVDKNLSPTITPTIHHSTYAAICRRLVQKGGEDLPLEKLGIFVGSKVTVNYEK